LTKKICILGSTGSVGTQALEVIEQNPILCVYSLVARKNTTLLEEQARRFSPKIVCIYEKSCYMDIKNRLADTNITVLCGEEGIKEAIDGSDTVLSAIVGIAGLLPTVYAIEQKKQIALANKETMVAAGSIVTRLANENNVAILPVDSEHSAIFQSLQGMQEKSEIQRLILTASGGPFFGKSIEELSAITPEMALCHPNWSMGKRITIDSATLANKGLEVMEAMWLFSVPLSSIKVVVHPQSIIHSLVEYRDGAMIAELGVPDMKIPIAYALTYPNRMPLRGKKLDLTDASLSFFKPDIETFSALPVAFEAAKSGGVSPAIFNGADEEAVALFLEGRIPFLEIAHILAKAVADAPHIETPTLSDIIDADEWARHYVRTLVL